MTGAEIKERVRMAEAILGWEQNNMYAAQPARPKRGHCTTLALLSSLICAAWVSCQL